MLVGVGALVVGMQHRAAPGRAAAPAAISPIDSGPITSFDTPGLLTEPESGSLEDLETSVVRIQGVQDGAGVVVDGSGIVLTSAEVVGNLPDVTVTFADGTTLTGTGLGTDPVTNLAVVDLPGDGYQAARMLGPTELRPDDDVLCAGVDDDGFRTIVGSIFAPRAPLRVDEDTTLDGLIQIEPASVTSPQRLGCAVVDGSGAVLAVTTSHDSLWYYATPIQVARKVANDVLGTGAARHAWIGILSGDTDDRPGVELADVDPDGPAADELRPGDVIIEVDGNPVPNMSTLVAVLQTHAPGDEIAVLYQRHGRADLVNLELDPLPRADG